MKKSSLSSWPRSSVRPSFAKMPPGALIMSMWWKRTQLMPNFAMRAATFGAMDLSGKFAAKQVFTPKMRRRFSPAKRWPSFTWTKPSRPAGLSFNHEMFVTDSLASSHGSWKGNMSAFSAACAVAANARSGRRRGSFTAGAWRARGGRTSGGMARKCSVLSAQCSVAGQFESEN